MPGSQCPCSEHPAHTFGEREEAQSVRNGGAIPPHQMRHLLLGEPKLI